MCIFLRPQISGQSQQNENLWRAGTADVVHEMNVKVGAIIEGRKP
jgi:hypothetical protein